MFLLACQVIVDSFLMLYPFCLTTNEEYLPTWFQTHIIQSLRFRKILPNSIILIHLHITYVSSYNVQVYFVFSLHDTQKKASLILSCIYFRFSLVRFLFSISFFSHIYKCVFVSVGVRKCIYVVYNMYMLTSIQTVISIV